MKNRVFKIKQMGLFALVLLLAFACERDISDDAVPAGFSTEGRVFIDNFIGMGVDFYKPFADSNFEAFSVDNNEGYESNASYRVDVPNPDNQFGNYAGAILRVDGAGRDLRDYDALTFWAKASRGVLIDQVGFGQDFLENEHQVTAAGLSFGTSWSKYIIPIPDASKLSEERGVFWYAMGTQPNAGSGYTVWFDDIQFENLGTVAQSRPTVFNGQDLVEQTFTGVSRTIDGLTQTFNLANGLDQTVFPAAAYYTFSTSDASVATVNDSGEILVVGTGTAVITAELNGVEAQGSLTLVSSGDFVGAPIPPNRNPQDVISLFSDAYTNAPVDYYNGFFAPFQTTQGGAPPLDIGGDMIINYTQLNFVGIGTFLNVAPVDATGMTHVHVDINVQEEIDPGDFIRLQLLNGVQTDNEIAGNYSINGSELATNEWRSFDIPLSAFDGLSVRNALGLFFFISDATISNIYVDNVYYYVD